MIYFWDARGYWQEFNNSSTILANSLYDYSIYLINSIRASDYNASSIILTTPFGILLGTSRVVYISTLVGLYLIPLCGLLAALINFIDANVTTARKNFLIWFIIAVSYPSLWFPTLRGAPDIVGLIPFVAAIWLITKHPTDRIRLWPYIFLGLLLWAPFLFRRWYVYSVLALCVTSPFLSLYLSSRQKAFKKALFFTVINYAFSALILVTCILVVQTEFVRSIIQNTYSEEFASYQVPFAIHLRSFVDYFGVINLVVIALSIVSCFLTPRYAPFLIFGLSNLAVTIILFTRMQAFDVHHYLPVSFWCLYLTCLALAACTSHIKNSIAQSIVLVTLSLIFLSLSAASAVIAWNFEKPFIGALPSSAAPYHVANVNNYQLLTDKLLQLTADGEKISVFASSAKLNDSMLLSLSRERLTGKLAPVTQIDLRTGIDAGSILTRYAVVTNPAQTHLPTGQNIVKITNSLIIEGKGIGQAYRPISKDFQLDGMTATIYEKVRSFTHSEVEDYLETIFNIYPEWRIRYDQQILFSVIMSSVKLGDVWGRAEFNRGNNTFFLHPGANQPTEIKFPFKGDLFFRLASPCDGMLGATVTVGDGNGSTSQSLMPMQNEPVEFDTTSLDTKTVFVNIKHNGDARCDGIIMSMKSQ